MTTLWQTAAEAGLVVFLLTVAWRLHKYHEEKTTTIFRRFDDFKKQVDEKMDQHKERVAMTIGDKFVDKDVCRLIHDSTKERFIILEKTMEQGFKNLDEKMRILLKHNGH